MRIAFTLNGRTIAGLALAGGLAALVVGWSGLVSIAASSGHFGPVGWFLHWTMRNAVATQAAMIAVPADVDLSDPALIQRAAGHFATECATCHGAPGVAQSPSALAMMPAPPALEGMVGRWKDRELFWIVQHGIKYSGMPAWVSQERPDEIWAMVAFLRALPGLSPERYAELALGSKAADVAPGATAMAMPGLASSALPGIVGSALSDCARCHGQSGLGIAKGTPGAAAFPIIAGQQETYLLQTLRAYASGERQSGIMQPPAKRYDDATLQALAAHYARQAASGGAARSIAPETANAPGLPETPTLPSSAAPSVDNAAARSSRAALERIVEPSAAHGGPYDRAGLLDLGRQIATQGLPDRKLPACESCHAGEGLAKNPAYPTLDGQPEWYLSTQLHFWKERHRSGGPYAHLMDKIAIHMTDQQIEALANWYASQPAGR